MKKAGSLLFPGSLAGQSRDLKNWAEPLRPLQPAQSLAPSDLAESAPLRESSAPFFPSSSSERAAYVNIYYELRRRGAGGEKIAAHTTEGIEEEKGRKYGGERRRRKKKRKGRGNKFARAWRFAYSRIFARYFCLKKLYQITSLVNRAHLILYWHDAALILRAK